MVDLALLLVRLTLAAILIYHGVNKLTGTPGPRATAKFFDSLGMRPGRVYATLAAVTELGAGAALAVGVATALACAAVVSLMLVAAIKVTGRRGFAVERGGWEYNSVLSLLAVAVAVAGPGRWSIDHSTGLPGSGALGAAIAVVVGVGSALLLLAVAARTATN